VANWMTFCVRLLLDLQSSIALLLDIGHAHLALFNDQLTVDRRQAPEQRSEPSALHPVHRGRGRGRRPHWYIPQTDVLRISVTAPTNPRNTETCEGQF
jgi:hypothetical protein